MKRIQNSAVMWMCGWALAGTVLDAYANIALHQPAFTGLRIIATLCLLVALPGLLVLQGTPHTILQRPNRRYRWATQVVVIVTVLACLVFFGWQAYTGYYRVLIQTVGDSHKGM